MELQLLTKCIRELDKENLMQFLKVNVENKLSQSEVQKIMEACQDGMAQVSELYEIGEYLVGELILAGELVMEVIEFIKPIVMIDCNIKIGSIVLGTVRGDLHDIGKNIFRSKAEVAGFEVYDIGIDQPVSAFVNKVNEVKPDIVGMSGVMTLTLEAMKLTIDGLNESGLRNDVKIIIGGNPINQKICDYIGADAFANDADDGLRICQDWVKCRKYEPNKGQ